MVRYLLLHDHALDSRTDENEESLFDLHATYSNFKSIIGNPFAKQRVFTQFPVMSITIFKIRLKGRVDNTPLYHNLNKMQAFFSFDGRSVI